MTLKKVLRTAIIVEWVSIFLGFFTSEILKSDLPAQLQDYLQWQEAVEDPESNLFLILIFLLAYIISSIGIFLFKPWAKQAYLILNVVGLLVFPLLSIHTVEHALTDSILSIGVMTTGFILALLFFTNVYETDKNNTKQANEKLEDNNQKTH